MDNLVFGNSAKFAMATAINNDQMSHADRKEVRDPLLLFFNLKKFYIFPSVADAMSTKVKAWKTELTEEPAPRVRLEQLWRLEESTGKPQLCIRCPDRTLWSKDDIEKELINNKRWHCDQKLVTFICRHPSAKCGEEQILKCDECFYIMERPSLVPFFLDYHCFNESMPSVATRVQCPLCDFSTTVTENVPIKKGMSSPFGWALADLDVAWSIQSNSQSPRGALNKLRTHWLASHDGAALPKALQPKIRNKAPKKIVNGVEKIDYVQYKRRSRAKKKNLH